MACMHHVRLLTDQLGWQNPELGHYGLMGDLANDLRKILAYKEPDIAKKRIGRFSVECALGEVTSSQGMTLLKTKAAAPDQRGFHVVGVSLEDAVLALTPKQKS